MIINDTMFAVELLDILETLQHELHNNNVNLLSKITDTPNNVMLSCPYHKGGQEKKPSAGIHKKTGEFHCFT